MWVTLGLQELIVRRGAGKGACMGDEDTPIDSGYTNFVFGLSASQPLFSSHLPSAAQESVSLDEPSPAFIGPNGTISWAAKPNYLLKREATPANHGCLTWFACDEETG